MTGRLPLLEVPPGFFRPYYGGEAQIHHPRLVPVPGEPWPLPAQIFYCPRCGGSFPDLLAGACDPYRQRDAHVQSFLVHGPVEVVRAWWRHRTRRA